jgi:hypothetical protein
MHRCFDMRGRAYEGEQINARQGVLIDCGFIQGSKNANQVRLARSFRAWLWAKLSSFEAGLLVPFLYK